MQGKMNGLIYGYDEKCSPQNFLHNVLQLVIRKRLHQMHQKFFERTQGISEAKTM